MKRFALTFLWFLSAWVMALTGYFWVAEIRKIKSATNFKCLDETTVLKQRQFSQQVFSLSNSDRRNRSFGQSLAPASESDEGQRYAEQFERFQRLTQRQNLKSIPTLMHSSKQLYDLKASSRLNPKDHRPPWSCSHCFEWNYQVILNESKVCKTHGNQSIDLIFLIPSSHDRVAERHAIRHTWASLTQNNTSNFRHVFLFGMANDSNSMRTVEEESRQFHDVVILKFNDAYRNLTLKTMVTLRWLLENCNQTRFFLKVDDDMWVNWRALMVKLEPIESKLQTAVAGHCTMSSKVIRKPGFKWSATNAEYPAKGYPTYCSGTAYAGTVNVARSMVEVSKNVPYFHLEDVFLGLCLKQLNYSVQHLEGFYIDFPPNASKDLCAAWQPNIVTIHRVLPDLLYKYWAANCELGYYNGHKTMK